MNKFLLLLLKTVTAVGIFVCLYMLIVPRSLYWDEAAFVENIIRRGFGNLVSEQLVNYQTAPVLFLFLEKTVGAVFGYSETALRIPSFVAFIAVLLIQYLLTRKVYKIDALFTWAGMAISSTLGVFLIYATMIKPYMIETALILLVLLLYELYNRQKLKLHIFTAVCAVMILFSNQTLFFIAAVFIFEGLKCLIKKDYKQLVNIVLNGGVIVVVFGIYYFLWLRAMAEDPLMQIDWKKYAIRFSPFSLMRLEMNRRLIYEAVFAGIIYNKYFATLLIAFATGGFLISLKQRNRVSFVIAFAYLLFFTASHFYRAPVFCRLVLFAYAHIIIFNTYFFFSIFSKINSKWLKYLALIALLALFYNNRKVVSYVHYTEKGHEVNPLIEYVEKNIKEDETLFSFVAVNVQVKYKTNYTDRIGNSSHRIFYGQDRFIWGGRVIDRTKINPKEWHPWNLLWDNGYDGEYPNEIEEVIKARKVWLIINTRETEDGFTKLREAGTLQEIMNASGTYLYYFSAFEQQNSPDL